MMTADKDKLAQEVVDRLLELLPDDIFGDMRMGDWGDPWGEMMGWWFALNDVCYALELPTDPTYKPGMSVESIDTDDYRYHVLLTGILSKEPPTNDEVANWHKLFDTTHHALELLGKDY